MNKTLWEKASKLLYHFCENGFNEKSIKEMIQEFGNPSIELNEDEDEEIAASISYGPFQLWTGCDGDAPDDFIGTHVMVDDIHLVSPNWNTEWGFEITEGLKEFIKNDE